MALNTPHSKQPIPKSAKKVFQGKLFETWQWEQKLFNGSTKTFEKIKRPSTVMVLPITSEKKIILTDQEQPAEGRFIGLIGGIVEPGEDVLEAAKRELLEESGYSAKDFILWDAVQLINKIEWPVYTFVAKNFEKKQSASPDSGERIKLIEVTFDEFLKLSHKPNFRDLEVILKIHRIENDTLELANTKKIFFD